MAIFEPDPNYIAIIRGDLLEMYFKIENIPPESLNAVYFKCEDAGLYYQLAYSTEQDAYYLVITSDESERLRPVITQYDIVVEYINGERETLLHNAPFSVLKKRNGFEVEVEDE